jgi:hypothetical protein
VQVPATSGHGVCFPSRKPLAAKYQPGSSGASAQSICTEHLAIPENLHRKSRFSVDISSGKQETCPSRRDSAKLNGRSKPRISMACVCDSEQRVRLNLQIAFISDSPDLMTLLIFLEEGQQLYTVNGPCSHSYCTVLASRILIRRESIGRGQGKAWRIV